MATRGCIIAIDTKYNDGLILHITDPDLIDSIYCSDNGIDIKELPGSGVYMCTLEIKDRYYPPTYMCPEEHDISYTIIKFRKVYDLEKGQENE